MTQAYQSRQKSEKSKFRRWQVFSSLVLAAATIGASGGVASVHLMNLPNVQDIQNYRPMSDTFLYDDEGRAFASFAHERRIIAQYEDYPRVLYDAVLSIEDRDFEKHCGFNVSRILIAAYRDVVRRENAQGASTLTMQLARNLFLSPERTYSRKIRELILAVQIERRFTKAQIFTLYANQIYLGHGVYGFATGAKFYFGKEPRDLKIEEAALLAALPKAPNSYSPIRNPERALFRRNLVINSMMVAGKIRAEEAEAAKKRPIQLHLQADPNALAPYFTEEVRQYLERKYGAEQVHEAGLRVYTTLNVDLQKAANRAVMHGLSAYDRRHNFSGRLRESGVQGALLAIDNASGEVKAMVGGRDFNESQFNRATQALRQVGSSFKPYVYTAAIDQGATPEDVIVDAPVAFRTPSGLYIPHNYDQKFEGPITLRHALADSRNIPAIKVAEHLGIRTVISYVHRFGIAEPIPSYLPIALGAVELTLAEQTSAFSVFPNDGIRVPLRYVVKVTDFEGHILEQTAPIAQDVINQNTARVMTSMLREVVLHGTAAAANRIEVPVAGKTGTTNDFTDAWFVGFSPMMTCGVWVGFDERKSLGNKETGARAALPVWMEFMESAIAKTGFRGDFPPPSSSLKTFVATDDSDQRTPVTLVKQSSDRTIIESRAAKMRNSDQAGIASPSSRNDLDSPQKTDGPDR